MSVQAVLDFLKATHEDEELLARSTAAGSLAGVVAIAAESGFAFTEAEVRSANEMLDKAGQNMDPRELADEDLDAVAGGVNINNSHYPTNLFVNINNSHREIFGGYLVASVNNLF